MLPCRLANGTHAHPAPSAVIPRHARQRLTRCCGLNRLSLGGYPGAGQVAYAHHPSATLTAEAPIPPDLHVLSLPLAFILSYDQTPLYKIDFSLPRRGFLHPYAPATLLSSSCSSFFSFAALPQRSSASNASAGSTPVFESGCKKVGAIPTILQIPARKSFALS